MLLRKGHTLIEPTAHDDAREKGASQAGESVDGPRLKSVLRSRTGYAGGLGRRRPAR
jgi:hypothetical protein